MVQYKAKNGTIHLIYMGKNGTKQSKKLENTLNIYRKKIGTKQAKNKKIHLIYVEK